MNVRFDMLNFWPNFTLHFLFSSRPPNLNIKIPLLCVINVTTFLVVQNSKCSPNAVSAELLFLCCLLQAASFPSPWLFASQRSDLSSVSLYNKDERALRGDLCSRQIFFRLDIPFCFGTKHPICSVIFSVFL